MSILEWTLAGLVIGLILYAILVGALVVAGRRDDARTVATFIPDCAVLFRRLLGDPRVERRRKVFILAVIGYLAMPFDLVPDFVPVAGVLDDALLVAVALRAVLRSGGPELLREHWPGPDESLGVISRLAFGSAAGSGRR
jgi:uncharacterized membrane protein YkvA (DUF1232 family)